MAVAGDGATDGSAFLTLALQNSGVPGGPHKLVVGAFGQTLFVIKQVMVLQLPQTGADAAGFPTANSVLELDGLNIATRTGSPIDFIGEQVGTDIGTVQMCVTVFFS